MIFRHVLPLALATLFFSSCEQLDHLDKPKGPKAPKKKELQAHS